VGNLPADAEVDALKQIFSRFGLVTNIEVKSDKSKRGRLYGIVEMPEQDEAWKAVKRLDRQMFRGAFMNVRRAGRLEPQSPFKATSKADS